MGLSPDTSIVVYYTLTYLLAVLAPLIPAILIYKLFPDTKVSIGGPLSGLTLKAGGAFAVYVVTFLLSTSLMSHFRQTIDTFVTPVWTVKGDISLVDENGKPITDPQALNSVTIDYIPNLSEQKFGKMQLLMPINNSQWPYIHIGLGERGSADLEYPFSDFDPKSTGRTISLNKPVTIKLRASQYNPVGTGN